MQSALSPFFQLPPYGSQHQAECLLNSMVVEQCSMNMLSMVVEEPGA